jgi:thioredoxin 2
MSDSLHIVCPDCLAVNRITSTRIGEKPKCGKCHQSLFSAHPVELTSANFQQHLSRNDIPLLIDFWAPWCGPCKTMAPAFEQAAAQLEPKIRLAKLNTGAEQTIGSQYGIRSIPTLILFQNGREIAQQSGAMGAADIVRWTQSQL